MLSRLNTIGQRSTGFLQPAVQCRGMATEKQLKTRMKAIRGIGKITKAMRMVSLAKLRRSQDQLERCRSFTRSLEEVWPESTKEATGNNFLIVAVVADRGLCGGANSTITRTVKRTIAQAEADKATSSLLIYGEKGRNGLERQYKKLFTTTISDWAKNKFLTFRQISDLTGFFLELKFDRAQLVFNQFKNMMVYNTVQLPLVTFDKAVEESKFDTYEMEGDADILQNLYEYRMGAKLFRAMAENETSELSARMTAMGNSSKNADEMLVKVRSLYNRTRQSRITTELVEIIGGVVSMDAK